MTVNCLPGSGANYMLTAAGNGSYNTPGWNFISLSVAPPNPSITTVLTDISFHVRIVWGFDNTTKLWKKWGKEKPADWQSLQIPETGRQALWVSHAGVGSHVTVGILRKSW